MNTEKMFNDIAKQKYIEVMNLKEEILTAFIAKFGCQPEEVLVVDTTSTWQVAKPREVDPLIIAALEHKKYINGRDACINILKEYIESVPILELIIKRLNDEIK